MKQVIIVMGQSASGKTTFVKNTFIDGEVQNIKPRKYVKACVCNNKILLGHYNIGKRCEGTDTLSYSSLPHIINFILDVFNEYDILIAEGDRVNSERFYNFIQSLRIPVKVYYLTCSLEESLKRRVKTGSEASEKFVKTTITKSKNMAEYCKSLGFDVTLINT